MTPDDPPQPRPKRVPQPPPPAPDAWRAGAAGSAGDGGEGEGGERRWKPDFARLPRVEPHGDEVRLHDLRDTRYPDPGEPYEVRWDTRCYRPAAARRLWLAVEPFMDATDLVAHTLLSFEFADGRFLAASVEARIPAGQSYSIVRGLLGAFPLMYLFGDERDLLVRRAGYQQHRLYLYPLVATPEQVQLLLRLMFAHANDLRERPRLYHSIRDNCTSVLVKLANAVRPGSFAGLPLAAVLPGLSDRTLARKGWIDGSFHGDLHGNLRGGASIAELKARHEVTEAVRRYQRHEAFSALIRRPPR